MNGRRHETIQTEHYLEELLAKPIDRNAESQTDLYLYEAPDIAYIPLKSGIDAATEIETGDLFDFDNEVEPILDALINMTMQQAMQEVVREDEWAELQREKEKYLAFRESQIAELRRLDKEQLDLIADNKLNPIGVNGITAAKLLHDYVSSLIPDILVRVNCDVIAKGIENNEEKFVNWLTDEVSREVGQQIDSQDLFEQLVKEIAENRADQYLKEHNESTLDNNAQQSTEPSVDAVK